MSRAKETWVNRKHSKTIIVIHKHLLTVYVGGWACKTVYWRSYVQNSYECMERAHLHTVTELKYLLMNNSLLYIIDNLQKDWLL